MIDYFNLLGISKSFEINLDILDKNYKKLVIENHPDNFDGEDDFEYITKTSQINTAFETLKDRFKRACYLLELNGTQALPENFTFKDIDFLQMQLEARDELEKLQQKSNSENILVEIEQFIKQYNIEVEKIYTQLRDDFSKPIQNELIQTKLQKLKYFLNLIQNAKKLKYAIT